MKSRIGAWCGVVAVVLLAGARPASGQEWGRFRGPNGSGVAEVEGLPVELGAEKNLCWKTDVAFGRSSPVLGEEVVYLTASNAEGLIVLCLDRKSGTVRWEQKLERSRVAERYQGTDSSAPSPVTDGKNVYVFFQELGVVSFDEAGEERWRVPLEPFNNFYGQGSSLVLAGELVIVPCDAQTDSYLLAIGKEDGVVRWRVERKDVLEGWTTPLLYPSEEEPKVVVMFGARSVRGYAVETGEESWRLGKLGTAPIASPVLFETLLFVSTPHHAEQGWTSFDAVLEGLDADGDGKLSLAEVKSSELGEHFGGMDVKKDGFIDQGDWDFAGEAMNDRNYGLVAFDLGPLAEGSAAEEMWRYTKNLPTISTPLFYRDVLYLVKDGGIVTCVDPVTGEMLSRKRLPDCGGVYYPSPVAGDGKVYIAQNGGKIAVLEAGAEGRVLAVNDLEEEIHATPAIGSDGTLFVRTERALHCFAKPR